jgi:hypothetical protein
MVIGHYRLDLAESAFWGRADLGLTNYLSHGWLDTQPPKSTQWTTRVYFPFSK